MYKGDYFTKGRNKIVICQDNQLGLINEIFPDTKDQKKVILKSTRMDSEASIEFVLQQWSFTAVLCTADHLIGKLLCMV